MDQACPPDEVIAAWLDGGLPPAERHDLEAHAAACTTCRVLAATAAGVTAVITGGAPRLGAAGATIGRYVVLGPAGAGAMGVVLRGRDPVLDREVAIKMVNAADDDPARRTQMLREAQTLARVDHPHVVDVYDAGEVGTEVFVAMEYVTGPTLPRWLADASRAVASRIEVLVAIGRGLAAVHDAGLVHRDVKPDNILVRERGGAVLVDFGLARPWREVGPAGSGIAGTPRFLAPEVRAGAAATPAADQYAWWTVVDEVVRDAAVPARRRARIDRAIARGRAEQPDARFAAMRDAVAALEQAVAPRRRWPWLVAGGAAFAALAVGAIAIATFGGAVDPCAARAPEGWTPARRDAIAAHVTAAGADGARVVAAIDARAHATTTQRAAACRAERASSGGDRALALRQLACIDQSWTDAARIFPGLVDTDREIVRGALDELITVIPVERCAEGAVPALPPAPPPERAAAAEAVQAKLRAIQLDDDLAAGDRVARMRALEAEVRALDYAPILGTWHAELSSALVRTGQVDAAKAELAESVRVADQAGDDEQRARSLLNSLRLAFTAGDADTTGIEASARAAAARLGNPAITAEVDASVGMARTARGDVAGAIEALRAADTAYAAIALAAHDQTVSIAQNLAATLQMSGDLAGAQVVYDRAYALARERFGDDAPDTWETRGARATNQLYAGDPAGARPELVAVADALARALGETSPQVMQARGFICEAELALPRDVADGRAACGAALAVGEAVFGPDHPQLVWLLDLVGQERLRAAAPAEAIAPLERALAIVSTTGAVGGDRERAVTEADLALALHGAHRDAARADRLARSAIAVLRGMPTVDEILGELTAAFPTLR